jgi:type II secretory pathway predicted ATPase ExeA
VLPHRNPFTPGAGTQPPELTGRTHILQRAETTLERIKARRHDRSSLLVGLRGVGKTVLLNRIYAEAEAKGFHAIILEAPEGRALADLIAGPMRQALLRLDLGEGLKDKVRRGLAILRAFASTFEVTIGDVGVGVKPAPGSADSGLLESDVTDLLVAVGEAAAERKSGVALLIDELQYLKLADLSALLAGLHRVSQLNLPLVMFAAGLPQLVGLTGKAKSYAERLFVIEELGPLGATDARKAIEEPIEREGAQIRRGALYEIIHATEGYPYFLQEWGAHAWNAAKASPITPADVREATKSAVAALDQAFFRVRFDRLTPAERNYLRAMAELGPGPHRSSDIARMLGRTVEKTAPLRARVIAKGMAYAPAHGDTAFTVPKFDEYLRRVIPSFTRPQVRKRKAD